MILSFLTDNPELDDPNNFKRIEWELMGLFKKYNIRSLQAAKTEKDLEEHYNSLEG